MVDFSGGFSEEYYTKDLSPDELFSTTIETFEKSSLMTCSTATVNEVITGLMSNHVYTITRGRITFDCYSRVHVYATTTLISLITVEVGINVEGVQKLQNQ